MKRLIISLMAIGAIFCGAAQTLHVENASVCYSYPAAQAGRMTFASSGGETVTILGKTHSLTGDSRVWVDETPVEDNTVTITYTSAGARVDIAGNIAGYVYASVEGAHVSVMQNDAVGEDTCGEITYRLSGESSDGSFSLEGSYKSSLELLGLTLTNPSGAALNIENGKRISVSVKKDTANSLTDGADGGQKGCIACKGHLEFKGQGVLDITGNASHAIYAKEYVEIKNCTVNILKAAKDGLNCNQYFLMSSGSLDIRNVGDDGIQVSFKDDSDRESEDTGGVTVAGGTISIDVTADAAKGVKCEGPMNVNGGSLAVSVHGDGIWDSAKSKTKAAACLASDADMTIAGGSLLLTATGGGGKGINADGALTIDGGDITINTSGGVCAYVNGTLNNNYTGSTDRLDSDMKSSPKGIKADGNVTINGGEIKVVTTGKGAEGIESKAVLTINDGTINVASTDDAINSSSHMYIKGGNITVVASGNDGLDSNGNLYIQGGYIMAFGSARPECGIDANEEEGYTVVFTGGTLLAVGGGNSVPSASSGSTQPYVSGSATVTPGTVITLSDSEGTALATFTVPANYSSSSSGTGGGIRPGGGFGGGTSVLVTTSGLTSGDSYTLTCGTTSTALTARTTGSSSGRPW